MMNRLGILLLAGFAFSVHADPTRVIMSTSMGDVVIELDAEKAPISVANFLSYVDEGEYDGTIFHRVIEGFMIQGGGFAPGLKERPARAGIRNEADNGLKNTSGTIAMARTDVIDSAGRQFYINVADNGFLDHTAQSCSREAFAEEQKALAEARAKGLVKPARCKSFGYAVFGKVIEGMDVVHAIEVVETGMSMGYNDVPKEVVMINSIRRLDDH